uniref:HERV-H LTR-associating protein 2 n=1 Tax=Maylandia zebra TaxID=106582 RepID=A0A3P9CWM3_9CICH
MLPCSSQDVTQIIIHWFKMSGDILVHSFYNNKNQHGYQDQRFRDRTSLFKDQISKGNVSLQLAGVKVQDEGRYKCHISTLQGNRDSFINLNVNAPVQKVNIQQTGNQMTCSSEGLYPKPNLTWTTSPPSNMSLQYKTTAQETQQLLYNINSSLMVSERVKDLDYSCTISTHRNRKRATLSRASSVISSYTETTLPCSSSNTSLRKLLWRFNHGQIILTKTGPDAKYTVSERWKQHVRGVSESGSLTLQNLSADQEGTYTCELSDASETITTNIFVKLNQGNSTNIESAIGWVFAVVLVGAAVAGLVLFCKKKRGQQENHRRSKSVNNVDAELQELSGDDSNLRKKNPNRT